MDVKDKGGKLGLNIKVKRLEMAQDLRALVVLAEDPSLVPSTPKVSHNPL